jgi:hypothetical protein
MAAIWLVFMIHQKRREFASQPTSAASLNVSEPWWNVLRSLARTVRRFETWQEVVAAIEAATASGMPTRILSSGDGDNAINRFVVHAK